MKTKKLLMIAISLGMAAMVSCNDNKNQNDETTPADDSTQLIEVEAPSGLPTDTIAETPAPEPAAATEEPKTADNGEINIKVTPGKLNKKYFKGADGWDAVMTLTVTNQSDFAVSGKDYSISYKCKEDDGTSEDPEMTTTKLSANGIDLAPGESGQITIKRQDAHKFYDFKVKTKK